MNLSLFWLSSYTHYSLNSPYTMYRIVGRTPSFPPMLSFFFGLSSFFPGPGQVPLLKKVISDHFQRPGLSVRNSEMTDTLYYIWFTLFMTAFLVFLFMDSLLPFKMHCKAQETKVGLLLLISNASIPQCFCTQWVLSGRFLICYEVGFCIWHVYVYLTF